MIDLSHANRAGAINRASRYFDDGHFQAALSALVAYPTESQTPDRAPDLLRYLTEAMTPRLEDMGFVCEIFDNPDPRGGPFLIGARIEDPSLTTVLTYGHGDVILAQTDQWREGLAPFTLVEEGDRLYGRGTADNKGQHLINLAALEAVLPERGHLGFNVRIIIEMSEETGSAELSVFFAAQKQRLSANVLIASDGPRLHPDTPTMFMGSRGAVGFDLEVNLREGAHHSGNWGGLLADPAIILAHALSTICDRRGQILVPEWRPDSLTEPVRAALRGLPIEGATGPAINPEWGEERLTPAERVFGWNSFAILAMTSGVPDAPVNAISGCARATCQLRFVVGTDAQDILPALRRHLDKHDFQIVTITPQERGGFAARRLNPDVPWVKFVERSLTETAGKPPHVLPNLAGSLPNDSLADVLGLPTVWIPHSYRGCSQHAPDEHVLKPVCRDALRIMAGLFWEFADANNLARD